MEPFDHFEEMGACTCLFLDELVELESNGLRIRLTEGIRSKVAVPLEFAGHSMGEGFSLRATAESARYELTWRSYVLYQVTNESFGQRESSEAGISNNLTAALDSSSLLEYVSRSTIASNEYPGKLTHYRVVCSDHIVDVVSSAPLLCERIAPKLKVH